VFAEQWYQVQRHAVGRVKAKFVAGGDGQDAQLVKLG
jgi:hypothetical protein